MNHGLKLLKHYKVQTPFDIGASTIYETIMGSQAYGVNTDNSDLDLVSICVPPKHMVFPHLVGKIPGYGEKPQNFEVFQNHHMADPDGATREYDLSSYSIIKFCQLATEGNPNIIDSLFTPINCITHITSIGEYLRSHRKLFLHKGCYHKFKGYAYTQLHKMKIKQPEPGSKRAAIVEKFGFDTKFAYHLVRLLYEMEQIFVEQDLDLQKHKEFVGAVKRGEVPEAEIYEIHARMEKRLESLYETSALPYKPDEDRIRIVLLNCLEQYYGTIDDAITQPDKYLDILQTIKELVRNI